jgi:ParB family chromosome partitioning protein
VLNKKRGLGKGLNALLPGTVGEKDGKLRDVDLEEITVNPRQPRQTLNDEKLEELASSIKEHGVVQPIVVRQLKDGKYQLIAGQRRLQACRELGLKSIPAVIRDYGDLEAAAVALIENIQRENLNPLEEARAYKLLMEDFGLTQENVSQRVGKSRPFVGNLIRLLMLPDKIQQLLLDNKISASHGRAILGLEQEEKQLEAAKRIVKDQMSVRQAEGLVKQMGKVRKRPEGRQLKPREYRVLEKDLGIIIQASIKIRNSKDGGGRLVIDFKNPEEMLGFLASIKK